MSLFRCPTRGQLDEFALGHLAGARLKRHVEKCAPCQRVLAELRADAELIGQLREAAELLEDVEAQACIRNCLSSGQPHANDAGR